MRMERSPRPWEWDCYRRQNEKTWESPQVYNKKRNRPHHDGCITWCDDDLERKDGSQGSSKQTRRVDVNFEWIKPSILLIKEGNQSGEKQQQLEDLKREMINLIWKKTLEDGRNPNL